jgi:hypothetical protein
MPPGMNADRTAGGHPVRQARRQTSECRREWTLTELLVVILFARPVAG